MFHFNSIFDKPPTIYAGVILYFLLCIIRKLNNLRTATWDIEARRTKHTEKILLFNVDQI
jgi:hypothetical protein